MLFASLPSHASKRKKEVTELNNFHISAEIPNAKAHNKMLIFLLRNMAAQNRMIGSTNPITHEYQSFTYLSFTPDDPVWIKYTNFIQISKKHIRLLETSC